jgi:hypothetical protein
MLFPVVVADYEGERYLVAMLGEGVNWSPMFVRLGVRPCRDAVVCRRPDATKMRPPAAAVSVASLAYGAGRGRTSGFTTLIGAPSAKALI